MDEIGSKLYDFLTEDYKDKIDITKDIEDYLKEMKKQNLTLIYLYYSYASNELGAENNTIRLMSKNKTVVINTIQKIFEKSFVEILKFFSKEILNDLKLIAKENEFFRFCKAKNNKISLNSIRIFKNLGLIFCKKEGDDIFIHMPKYIKNKLKNINSNIYTDSYINILELSEGLVQMYGAIVLEKAYMIIKDYISVDYSKYISIIKFASGLELNMFHCSLDENAIYNVSLDESEVEKFINVEKKIYSEKDYLLIANETDGFLESLEEFKKFNNFMKNNYGCDINDDLFIKLELINSYIDKCQIDEKKAKEELHNKILESFEVAKYEEMEMMLYIEEIRKKFPIWKDGRNDNT